jgi:hypothetical protein
MMMISDDYQVSTNNVIDKLENSLISNHNRNTTSTMDDELVDFVPWSTRRHQILQLFTTNEKLTIVTNFLPGGIPLTSQISIIDKTAHRLI